MKIEIGRIKLEIDDSLVKKSRLEEKQIEEDMKGLLYLTIASLNPFTFSFWTKEQLEVATRCIKKFVGHTKQHTKHMKRIIEYKKNLKIAKNN